MASLDERSFDQAHPVEERDQSTKIPNRRLALGEKTDRVSATARAVLADLIAVCDQMVGVENGESIHRAGWREQVCRRLAVLSPDERGGVLGLLSRAQLSELMLLGGHVLAHALAQRPQVMLPQSLEILIATVARIPEQSVRAETTGAFFYSLPRWAWPQVPLQVLSSALADLPWYTLQAVGRRMGQSEEHGRTVIWQALRRIGDINAREEIVGHLFRGMPLSARREMTEAEAQVVTTLAPACSGAMGPEATAVVCPGVPLRVPVLTAAPVHQVCLAKSSRSAPATPSRVASAPPGRRPAPRSR